MTGRPIGGAGIGGTHQEETTGAINHALSSVTQSLAAAFGSVFRRTVSATTLFDDAQVADVLGDFTETSSTAFNDSQAGEATSDLSDTGNTTYSTGQAADISVD